MRAKIPWDRPSADRFTITDWEIDPARTALIIVDAQQCYVDPGKGVGPLLQQEYPDIYGYYYPRLAETVIPNILRLQDFFRGNDLAVIYTRMGFQLPGARDLPPWNWRATQLRGHDGNFFPRGSQEYELVAELKPLPHELVLDKNSMGPFASTALDQLLRNMGIENLVVTGVLTNVAVESTARDAGDRGYNPITVEDAIAAYRPAEHEDTLANASWWVVKSTDEVVQTLGPLLTSA